MQSSREGTYRLLLLLLTVLAFALRIPDLAGQSLTNDEAVRVWISSLPDAELLPYLLTAFEENPPLYYLLLRGWMALAGNSEFAVRYLSIIWGVALIPALFLLGRRLLGKSGALVSTFLMTFSPFFLFFSQDASMYTLLVFLTVLSSYFCLRAMQENRPRLWVAYALLSLLAWTTHYFALLVILAQNAYFLIRAKQYRDLIGNWMIAQATILLPFVLWLLSSPGLQTSLLHAQMGKGGIYNAGKLWRALRLSELGFSAGVTLPEGQALLSSLPSLLLVLLWLVAAIIAFRRGGETRQKDIFLLLYLGLPLLLAPYLPVLLSDLKSARYLMVAAPAYIMILAAGSQRIATFYRLPQSTGLLLVGLVFLSNAYGIGDYFNRARWDYNRLVATIQARREPGDALILDGPYQRELFIYYAPQDWNPIYLPPYIPPPLDPEEARRVLREVATPSGRVWLVQYATDLADPLLYVYKWLGAHGYLIFEEAFHPAKLSLFEFPKEVTAVPEVETNINVGDKILLQGYTLDSVGSGAIRFVLFWEALVPLEKNYALSLRLRDSDWGVVYQRDAPPLAGFRPTSRWEVGKVFTDYQAIPLPEGLVAGDYTIEIRIYNPQNLEELPIVAADGVLQWTGILIGPVRLPEPSAD